MSTTIGGAWLAAEGLEDTLAEDLSRRGVTVERWHGQLALSSQPAVYSPWALDILLEPECVAVASIREAADTLRARQRNWSLYAATCFGRARLVEERLPPV
ncbi:MAG: hypothetical protein ABF946_09155, partial [Acetobacter papayae]